MLSKQDKSGWVENTFSEFMYPWRLIGNLVPFQAPIHINQRTAIHTITIMIIDTFSLRTDDFSCLYMIKKLFVFVYYEFNYLIIHLIGHLVINISNVYQRFNFQVSTIIISRKILGNWYLNWFSNVFHSLENIILIAYNLLMILSLFEYLFVRIKY
jgi:hypothetical protein